MRNKVIDIAKKQMCLGHTCSSSHLGFFWTFLVANTMHFTFTFFKQRTVMLLSKSICWREKKKCDQLPKLSKQEAFITSMYHWMQHFRARKLKKQEQASVTYTYSHNREHFWSWIQICGILYFKVLEHKLKITWCNFPCLSFSPLTWTNMDSLILLKVFLFCTNPYFSRVDLGENLSWKSDTFNI